jgi:hypothetical protein
MLVNDFYAAGLHWILREHGGPNGGWPPRNINRVSGWAVVRMLADLTNRSSREVAADLIDQSMRLDLGG